MNAEQVGAMVQGLLLGVLAAVAFGLWWLAYDGGSVFRYQGF